MRMGLFNRDNAQDKDTHRSGHGHDYSAYAGHGELVLIVDDSRTFLHSARRLLEAHGYATVTASDGAQALVVAKETRPDLVLMDIVMPRMSGFEATRILTRTPETRRIPVVLVSATQLESDKYWALRQGARGYLSKPIRKRALLAAVSGIINESRTLHPHTGRIPVLTEVVAFPAEAVSA